MSTEEPPSISRWIEALKLGEEEAVAVLWKGYWDRLVRLARRRLQGAACLAVEDEEDVALSAFLCLCQGVAGGRFTRLADRGDLWRLLVAITANKIRSRRQRLGRIKRGGGEVMIEGDLQPRADESDLPGPIAQILSREPDPEFAAEAAEECASMFEALPNDELRQIAAWRLEGLTVEEIAAALVVTGRTIGRKLERIRVIWLERALESFGDLGLASGEPE